MYKQSLLDTAHVYEEQAKALDVVADVLEQWGARDITGHTKNRIQKALGDMWTVKLDYIAGHANVTMYNTELGWENRITAYLHPYGDVYVNKTIDEATEHNIKDTRAHAETSRRAAEQTIADAKVFDALRNECELLQNDIQKKAGAIAKKYGHTDVSGTWVSYHARQELEKSGVHELVCELVGRELNYIRTK